MGFLSWLFDGVAGVIGGFIGLHSSADVASIASVIRRWLSPRGFRGRWLSRLAHWVWPDEPDSRAVEGRRRGAALGPGRDLMRVMNKGP